MARILTITRSPVLFTGTRKRTLKRPVAFGRVALSFMTVVLLALFSLLYLLQTNTVANLGTRIDRLGEERAVLAEEHKALKLQASELSSIRTIERSASSLRLTKAPIQHVEVPATAVAAR